MKKTILTTTLLISSLFSQDLVDSLEQDLVKSIMPGTDFTKIQHSPIDGIYEAYTQSGDIYYIHPSKRLILFGEIYTNKGKSLTVQSKKEYARGNKIITPLDQSIEKLSKSSEESKRTLKEIVENAVLTGTKDPGYKLVIIKSPTCPHCKDLDRYIEKTIDVKRYLYLAPYPQSEDIYKNKYGIQNPKEKLMSQVKIISKNLKGFRVPFALVIDENYNLVDTLKGFSEESKESLSKWNKYLGVKDGE